MAMVRPGGSNAAPSPTAVFAPDLFRRKSCVINRTRGISPRRMYARAFSTLGCSELTLDEAVALGRRNGIAQLELRALGGMLDLPAYFAANFDSPSALAAKLSSARVRIVALDTSFRIIDGSATDRSSLLEFLPWAEALGVRWLRAFDGGSTLDDGALTKAGETLAWWRSIRDERKLKIDLMIETHDVLLDAAKIQRFIAAMPRDSVRLLWDAHHTWKKGGEDPLVTWKKIGSHVVHVHVKDSVSAPSERHPFTYVLPGAGEFPMAALREKLAAEFSGAVSLEWEKLWHPYLPPLESALRSAADSGWW
jgi:sugar phosphate isomerase/epimerase